jgi:hypothetical protein
MSDEKIADPRERFRAGHKVKAVIIRVWAQHSTAQRTAERASLSVDSECDVACVCVCAVGS